MVAGRGSATRKEKSYADPRTDISTAQLVEQGELLGTQAKLTLALPLVFLIILKVKLLLNVSSYIKNPRFKTKYGERVGFKHLYTN